MTPSSTAGPDKFCRHDRAAYPVWLFQLIIFAAVYTAARSADCRATSLGSELVPARSLFCYILPFQEPDVILLRLFTRHFCRLALMVYPSDHSFVIFYRFKSRMSSLCAFLRDIFAAVCTAARSADCRATSPGSELVPARSLFCYILPF